MKRIALLCGVLALVVACQDHGQLTAPDGGQRAGLLDGSNGGTPGFFFLPPLAAEPEATGEFDAELEPRVEICPWLGAVCGPLVAEFSVDGSGAARVRADATEGHYIVNWDTRQSQLDPGVVYRIRVVIDGFELGYVDAFTVSNGRQAKDVADGHFPLQLGRTVPIKFRIEVGAHDPPTATIVGQVTDLSGAGLAGATATLEGTALFGTTSSAGGLTLHGVRTGRTAVVRLSLAGYVDQLVQLEVPDGVDRVMFRTSMIQKAAPVVLSASSGGTATSTDGAAVVLPASGLVDGAGNPVSGDVDVSITPVDVSGDGIDAFPGSFTGINSDGDAGLLMTYGVAEYTFEQNGEELQLAPGQTATVIIPIYTGEAGLSLGDQIPLWYLDESTGDWIEESIGTVVALASSPTGLGLEAEVSHFSWWNIDVWVDSPYEPWVRCFVDGSPADCTVYATVDDPSFPRTNATTFLPSSGGRLSFPAAPVVTELSGESGNRYGSVVGGVSGPSGGGSADTVVVDLTETGVLSGDQSVVTTSATSVEIPNTITFFLEARDETGAPMSSGGASVIFDLYKDGILRFRYGAVDNGDGTYQQEIVPQDTGTFAVVGIINGSFVTTGSPEFTATWSATAGRGATSTLGASPTSIPVGGTATLTVQAHTEGGTPKTSGGDVVLFGLGQGGALVATGTIGPMTDNGDGTYTATFTGTGSGTPVEITARINGELVTTGNPSVEVTPAILSEADALAAIAEAFNHWWLAGHGTHMEWTQAVMGDGPSSSWFNFAMGIMSAEPRPEWDNSPSYNNASVTLTPWLQTYTAISRAYDVLWSLDAGLQINGGADNDMARAAAKLVQGLAHAQLALTFDQAFILDESVDLSTTSLSLQPYGTVMDAALGYLDEAIAIAGGTSFTLPADWIQGAPLTSTELIQVAHSYSARLMAAVARTPAERAAADWAGIRSHIAQGITADFGPVSDGNTWYDFFKGFVHRQEWFRADYRMIGGVTPGDPETDPAGDLTAWLALAPDDRLPYASQTADQRVWDGTLDGAGNPNPGSYFSFFPNSPFRADRGTYHFSHYGFTRYPADYGLFSSGDFLPALSTVEMDLLEAEALIRTGQPGAALLINQTRVNNGGLSPATDADADLFDKLAYEKRLETYHLNGALTFWDRRGWGTDLGPNDFGQGLMDGTPYHFPVPGRELERLGIPNYTFGGAFSPMGMSGRMARMHGVPAVSIYRRGGEIPTAVELVLDVERAPAEPAGRSRGQR